MATINAPIPKKKITNPKWLISINKKNIPSKNQNSAEFKNSFILFNYSVLLILVKILPMELTTPAISDKFDGIIITLFF